MTTIPQRDVPGFPIDPRLINGIRINGTVGITPVDAGSAEVVPADGELWLHWTHGGIHHAVNFHYIVEFVSTTPDNVIDLTEPGTEPAGRIHAAARSGSS